MDPESGVGKVVGWIWVMGGRGKGGWGARNCCSKVVGWIGVVRFRWLARGKGGMR